MNSVTSLLTAHSPALFAAIAIGGAAGAVLRYLISSWCLARFGDGFPWGTLTVNLLGSLLIGLLVALLNQRALDGELWRPLLVVGLLGSLTTFSTFSLETVLLLQRGEAWLAACYIACSVFGCLLLTYLGFTLISNR